MADRLDVVHISSGSTRGTGMLLAAERVLTALHVIGRVDDGRVVFFDGEARITAAVWDGTVFRFPVCVCTAADVIDFDPELDWVCLRVDAEAFAGVRSLPVRSLEAAEAGGEWTTYGFPETSPKEGKASGGVVSSTAATLRMGAKAVGVLQLFSREAAAGLGGFVRGFSGAPVLLGPHAVGLLCAASEDEHARSLEGTLYAVPLASIAERAGIPDAAACPYPGLRPFQSADARHFHGRDAESNGIVRRLHTGESQILIVGASGSGKSSLLHAGVVPRLLASSGRFLTRWLRPGSEPYRNLLQALGNPDSVREGVAALLRQHRAERLVLCIDQLEELFTQASDPIERAAFVEGHRVLTEMPEAAVVLTLRADFYGDLLESELWQTLRDRVARVDLAPLRGAALATAIEAPARDVGVLIEASLRERLIADAATEPGALPLLQVVLAELWEQRTRGWLHLDDYLALGEEGRSGLAVALERRADAVLHALTPEEQVTARRIFLRLINLDEARPSTRRQQPSVRLRATGEGDATFARVLERLAAGRLITLDQELRGAELVDVVDLAHESLILAWPALRHWLEERQEDERRRRTLEGKADEWRERGSGEGGLLDRVELAEAEEWLRRDAARDVGFSEALLALVAASRHALERSERTRQRRIRNSFLALGSFALVVSALSLFAWQQWLAKRSEAENAARESAEAKRQSAEATRNYAGLLEDEGIAELEAGNPERALAHLAKAYELNPTSPSLKFVLHDATRPLDNLLLQVELVPARKPSHEVEADAAATSAQARAAAPRRQFVSLGVLVKKPSDWQIQGHALPTPDAVVIDGRRKEQVILRPGDVILRVGDMRIRSPADFYLAEKRLALDQRVEIELWRAGARQTVWAVGLEAELPAGDLNEVDAQQFAEAIQQLALDFLEDSSGSAALNHDGSRLATVAGNNEVVLWDVNQRTPVRTLLPADSSTGEQRAVAFSADSRTVLVHVRKDLQRLQRRLGDDAALFDADDGRLLSALERSSRCAMVAEAFSLNNRLIGQCEPNVVASWDLPSARLVRYEASPGAPLGLSSVDGAAELQFATASGSLCTLKREGREAPVCFSSGFSAIDDALFLDDDVALVSQKDRKTLISLSQRRPLRAEDALLGSSSRRRWQVTADKGKLEIRDPIGGRLVRAFEGLGSARGTLSPDARRVAVAHRDRVTVFDVMTGHKVVDLQQHPNNVGLVAFSGDGRRLVGWSADGTTRVSSVDGRLLNAWTSLAPIWNAAFVGDDSNLAVLSADKTVSVRDPLRRRADRSLGSTPGDAEFVRELGAELILTRHPASVRLWRASDLSLARELPHAGVEGASVHESLVLTYGGGALRLWRAASGALQRELPFKLNGFIGRLGPGGRRALFWSASSGEVEVVDIQAGGSSSRLPANDSPVLDAFFLPGSELAAVGYRNGRVRILDAQGKILHEFGGDASRLEDLAPGDNQGLFVSSWARGFSPRRLERRDARSAKLLAFEQSSASLRGRVIDARRWARLGLRDVSIVDSASGRRVARFNGSGDTIRATAVAEGQPWLALIEDAAITTWDLREETRGPDELRALAERLPWKTGNGRVLDPAEPRRRNPGLNPVDRVLWEEIPRIAQRYEAEAGDHAPDAAGQALQAYKALITRLDASARAEPGLKWRNALIEAHLRLAELLLFNQKKPEEARPVIDRALRLSRSEPPPLDLLARAQTALAQQKRAQGDKAAALSAYQDVLLSYERLAKDPAREVEAQIGLFDTLLRLADAHDEQGNLPAARQSSERALRVADWLGSHRLDPARRNQRGWLLLILGEFERAHATFTELVKNSAPADTTFSYYLTNLALASLLTRRTEEAASVYRRGLTLPFANWFRESCLADIDLFRKRGFASADFARAERILRGESR